MIFLRESWDWDRARPGLDRADAMMGNSEKTSLLNPSSGSKDILAHPFFFIIEPLILPPQIACPTPTHSAQEFLKSFYVAFVKKPPKICSIQEQSLKGLGSDFPPLYDFFPLVTAASEMIFRFESALVMEWKVALPRKMRPRREHLASSDSRF